MCELNYNACTSTVKMVGLSVRGVFGRGVIIEDDCWLGVNVVVMAGIKICKGAVVGANSVVTKDVGPYSVVAGAPAKEVSLRLPFKPPSSITYNNANDWPYFYSGFEMDQLSLAESVKHLGVEFYGDFELCLNTKNSTYISLIVKSNSTLPIYLRCQSEERKGSNEFAQVDFKVDEVESNRIYFTFNRINDDVLFVQKAWAH